jgi:outer membrane protein OmpA-like peptidoglycan-associated protein
VVATVSLGPSQTAVAATTRQQPGEPRVRDLDYPTRDLVYRSRTLDNSERVEQSAEQITVTLAADVLFAFNEAALASEARERLDELATDLTGLGPRRVTITGHSDARGEPAYNVRLSEQRAEAVHAALGDRLGGDFTFEVTGRSEDEPVAPNENADGSDNPTGRALNRRVVIQYSTD